MLSNQDPNHQTGRPFILFRPFVAFWYWMFPPTQAHEDRRSSTSRIVAGFFIIAVCLGLIIAAVFYSSPVRKGYKTWNSNRLVVKAKKLEGEEKLTEAVLSANQAFIQDPDNPEAIRSLARYATMMKRPEARFLWRKLRAAEKMTDDDVILEIQALSYMNDDKSATDEVDRLLKTSNPTKDLVETADQVMQKLNRGQELLELLERYVQQKPEEKDILLLLATRQLQLGNEEQKKEGIAHLWSLTENKEATGLRAIELLNAQKMTPGEEMKKLATLLSEHPLAREEHRVQSLRRRAEIDPDQKKAIISKAVEERRTVKREEQVPLALWMSEEANRDVAYAEILLDYLPEEKVYDFPPLLVNHLNALTLLKQNDELKKVIENPRTRLTPAERSFYTAHLAFVTKEPADEIHSKLNDALSSAQSAARPDMLMRIAQYAEERGFMKVAEDSYLAAATMRRVEREAYDGLLRLTYRNGNSKGFLDAATESARRWPDNPFFLERSLYASLLAGIEMEKSVLQIEALLKAKPDDSQRKLIMALGYIRQSDPQSAAACLRNINLSELTLGQGAVLCGIMHTAGFTTQAVSISDQIPVHALMLPEEHRFIQRVRPRTP